MLDDRRVKVREIDEVLGISKERVGNILHEELNMRKLCQILVLHLITIDQKRISQACLNNLFIHHYIPEQKKQSKQWIERGGSAPMKAKRVPSAGKIMENVFWDYKNLFLIDYLKKGKIINSEYYYSLLDQLDAEILKKDLI